MNNIYLSKSRYCKARQCKKIIWLKKYKPEYAIQKARDIVLENGTKVGQLAKGLFGKYENIDFNENLNIMIDQTKKLLKNKPNIITEASFNYNNNFCSVDILKNDIDGVEIYEVKSSTEISDIYLDDVSYQYYILNNLEFNIKKACINIARNPIIIGIVLGFLASVAGLKQPVIMQKTIQSVAQTATPVALICIGAGFEGSKAIKKIKPTLIATFIKLVGIAIPVAVMMGFRNQELVAILIMTASPSTVTCYIMAKNMDNDGVLSSSIIVLTTLLSSITLTGWIFVLRSLGLI